MIKRGIMPPSYSGEAMAMTLFFPRHWLKRYNSRALHYVHELKSELSPKKYLKEASSIDMTYSDIKSAGLDKLDNILKRKDKPKIKINKNNYSPSEPTGTIIWVSHVVARDVVPIYLNFF
ncbi:hypothetical protein [Spiroplasma endosymbiont of Villa modesta]|uniref:hypothetical protein n=1 Tax=Spiroplasma endosymbiont of Villa modesta TaxID=3066293 RepID=UPI00313B86AF